MPVFEESQLDADHFDFVGISDVDAPVFEEPVADVPAEGAFAPVTMTALGGDGRGDLDPDPEPEPTVIEDGDPDPAPAPVVPPISPAAPTEMGRDPGSTAGRQMIRRPAPHQGVAMPNTAVNRMPNLRCFQIPALSRPIQAAARQRSHTTSRSILPAHGQRNSRRPSSMRLTT